MGLIMDYFYLNTILKCSPICVDEGALADEYVTFDGLQMDDPETDRGNGIATLCKRDYLSHR